MRLGKSCDPYPLLQLWLIVIKSWCCIGVCIRIDRVVWCWIKMSWIWIVICCLRCKCYEVGIWLTVLPYYDVIYKCSKVTYMNCNKGLWSCNSYWAMMIFIEGLDPMRYTKLLWLIKTLRTFENSSILA